MAFLTGYSKRKLAHWVKDGDVQANYQIQIVPHKSSDSDSGKDVYLGTNVQDDFDDIRLTKGDESTELDQWQESLISETSAIYWGEIHKVGSSLLSGNASSGQKVVDVNDGSVFAADDYALLIDDSNSEVCKIASINSNELTMVANLTNAYTTAANAKVCHCAYLYYKDDDAVLKSDGEDTFPFFDDFPGDSLDTNKWTDGSDGTGSVSVADSKVRIQAPNTSGHHGFAYTAADFVEPCALMVLGIDMDGIGNNQVQLNPGTDVGVTTNAARVDAYDLTGYGGGNSNVVWQIDYGGTPETVKTDADVGDTWNHDVEIQLKSDRKVEFFEDGVSKGTSTNPIEDVDFRIHLQTHGGRGVADWYADVVAVRKYIEGLTWGAWGEEESAGGAEYEKIATVYVGASVTASRLTDIVRTGAVALGLMVLAEKFREVIALVKIGLAMGTAATQSAAYTVGTTSDDSSIRVPTQRNSFYTAGRYWVFYCGPNGNTLVYRTSIDGSSWSSKTGVAPLPLFVGANYDLTFDGTYVHYIRNISYNGSRYVGIAYRRGTPQSDGTISWSATEQTVLATGSYPSFNVADGVSICVDSDGYPWIGYGGGIPSAYGVATVTKSSANDGTWATASGYPLTLYDEPDKANLVALASQTNGKLVALFYRYPTEDAAIIKARFYNGSSWETIENVTANLLSVSTAGMLCATSISDEIHLVYRRSATDELRYIHGHHGSWTSYTLISSASIATNTTPVVSAEGNNVFVFWLGSDDHVYYRKRNSSGNWDSVVDWLDETANDFTNAKCIQCSFTNYSSKIIVCYQTKTSSPYNVRFAFLTILPASSRLVELFRTGTTQIGLSATASRAVEVIRSAVVAIGQVITASKAAELFRTGAVTIGLGVSALRSKLTERVADVAVGLSTTASRLVEITRTSAVTIGEAVTASITGVVSVIADVQIGMSVSSSRLVEVARTSSVAVGLAATASYCKFKEFIGSVAIGMSVSASRAVEIIRSPVVQVGLSVTASRTVEIFRTATVAIGEIATAIIKAGREIVAVVFIGMSVSASRVKELVRAGTVALGLAVTASWLIPRIGRFLYVAITTSPYRKVRMVTAIYRSIKVFTFRR